MKAKVYCPFPEGQEIEGWPTQYVAEVDYRVVVEAMRVIDSILAAGEPAAINRARAVARSYADEWEDVNVGVDFDG